MERAHDAVKARVNANGRGIDPHSQARQRMARHAAAAPCRRRALPFRNPEDFEHRVEGLRKAGLTVWQASGEGTMDKLSFNDPLFATYVIAATLMILKVVGMSWLTVVRMAQAKGGFRSPEDLKKTPFNPAPHPKQLDPDERVERIRRIMMNDLENVPFFLVAGFLYVLTRPSLLAAQWLLYGYAVSRFLHFAAYLSGQIHEVRATFWTVGSLILIFMTVRTLLAALGY